MLSPISDVAGRIRHVCFALTGSDPDCVAPFLACFGGIATALGPGVRYTVVHHLDHAAYVERFGRETGISALDPLPWPHGRVLRLDAADTTFDGTTLRVGRLPLPDYTPWVQDTCLIAQSNGGRPCVLASPDVERVRGNRDEALPRLLAEHLGWELAELPGGVAGANVAVDGRHIVVGAAVRAGLGPGRFRRLGNLLHGAGRDRRRVVVVPGVGAQPLPHQDYYVALAGDDRALVGSVRAARDLGWPIEPGRGGRDPETELDAVARQLERLGYDVSRLPLAPLSKPATRAAEPGPDWISYTNCLVEVFRSPEGEGALRRRVILPAYGTDGGAGLAALDRAAARVWADLGFEAALARGPFTWLAALRGSVRCMTKVPARDA